MVVKWPYHQIISRLVTSSNITPLIARTTAQPITDINAMVFLCQMACGIIPKRSATNALPPLAAIAIKLFNKLAYARVLRKLFWTKMNLVDLSR